MDYTKIPAPEDRGEWLAIRKRGIGGSEAAALVGLNDYSSPYEIWADKMGLLPEKEDSEAMRIGRDLEDYVAKRWSEKTGKKVQRYPYMLTSSQYPFACANIDRKIVGERAGLECKTVSALSTGKYKNGEYPDRFYVQCVHYLAVTGWDRWYLAVLVLGSGLHTFVIERDEDEIAALMQAEKDFWERHVLTRTPPEVDGSVATADAVKQIFPTGDPGSSMSLAGYESLLERRASLKASVKELEEEVRLIETRITAQMGTCEKASCGDWKVSYKTQSRSSFDRKALERDYPDIPYNIYTTTSESRVLRITGGK